MEDSERGLRIKTAVSIDMEDLVINSKHLCCYLSTISVRTNSDNNNNNSKVKPLLFRDKNSRMLRLLDNSESKKSFLIY